MYYKQFSPILLLFLLNIILPSGLATCPSFGISNGRLRCTSSNNEKSHCLIECNSNFAPSTTTPAAIMCISGVWRVRNNNLTLNILSISCNPSQQEDVDRRSLTFERPKCSNVPCDVAYNGITQGICQFLQCCWDADATIQCKNKARPLCTSPLYYRGITRRMCEDIGCIYEPNDSSCYMRRPQDQQPTRTTTVSVTTTIAPQVTCPELTAAVLSSISCTDGENAGSVCTMTCDPGFVQMGNAVYTCNTSGNWSPTMDFSCRDLQCEALILDAYIISNCTNERYRNSECMFTCQAGYNYSGVDSKTCLDSGEWSEGNTLCVVNTCGQLNTSQNVVKNCTNGESVGSVCQLSCSSGHTYSGESEITCINNGSWSGNTGICQVLTVECPALPLENNKQTTTCTDGMADGSICTLSCKPGYMRHGVQQMTCQDGAWSTNPICIQISSGSGGCNFYTDLTSGYWFATSRKVTMQQMFRYPWEMIGSCNQHASFDIYMNQVNAAVVQLQYSQPLLSHLEIRDEHGNVFLQGYRFNLFYGQGNTDIFNNNYQVNFFFRYGSPYVYYKVTYSGNWEIRRGFFNIPQLASTRRLSLGINRSLTYSNIGSGVCSMCVYYA